MDDDPSILFGFGYHGNGVNTSTWTGYQLAKMIGECDKSNQYPDDMPNMVRGMSKKFPLSSLRRYYLQFMIRMYRLRDTLEMSSK